jgi:hypothetical protein
MNSNKSTIGVGGLVVAVVVSATSLWAACCFQPWSQWENVPCGNDPCMYSSSKADMTGCLWSETLDPEVDAYCEANYSRYSGCNHSDELSYTDFALYDGGHCLAGACCGGNATYMYDMAYYQPVGYSCRNLVASSGVSGGRKL